MELKELRAFVAVARNKSVTRAAETLGEAQPTVSRRLKNLEKAAGKPLFLRNKRPLQLTPLGDRLFAVAVPLVSSSSTVESILTDSPVDRDLNVMVSGLVVENILPRAIKEFSEAHPDVRFNLRVGTEEEVAVAVVRGEVEFGLSHALIPQPGLVNLGLGRHDYVLLTQPDHPVHSEPEITLKKIAEYPLVLGRVEGHVRGVIENQFSLAELRIDVPFEVGSIGMIKKFVSLGFGLGILPRIAITEAEYSEFRITTLAHLLPLERTQLLLIGEGQFESSAIDLIAKVTEIVQICETEIGTNREERIAVTDV